MPKSPSTSCRRKIVPALLAVAAASSVAGCGTEQLDGKVSVAGSPTLEPFISYAVDQFAHAHQLVRFQVEMSGGNNGISRLCDGLVAAAGAAREMTPREAESCKQSGIEFIKLPVATDAIVLFTSRLNKQIKCISLPQVYALTGPEAVGVNRWNASSKVADSLGGGSRLPSTPFSLVGPQPGSGTRTLFVESAIDRIARSRGQQSDLRPDYTAVASDQIVVGEVAANSASLGFADYAAVMRAGSKVRPLALDAGFGCKSPTVANIQDGSYPLSRALYLYVNLSMAAERPSVAAFIDSLTEPEVEAKAASAAGVPSSAAVSAATRSAWLAASGRAGVKR
ncbi:MAG: substrate-binding domain-containing protein [Solirubrobacterales bacterium]|nr:substrate-binding domain-containing protein [Solirubrobacterales bacterium]